MFALERGCFSALSLGLLRDHRSVFVLPARACVCPFLPALRVAFLIHS